MPLGKIQLLHQGYWYSHVPLGPACRAASMEGLQTKGSSLAEEQAAGRMQAGDKPPSRNMTHFTGLVGQIRKRIVGGGGGCSTG